MSRNTLKHPLVTVAVVAGLLAGAGSASAASVYQHDQTDLELLSRTAGVQDGTSNTIMFGARAAAPKPAVTWRRAHRASRGTGSGGAR